MIVKSGFNINKVEHFALSSDDNVCWKHIANDPEVIRLGEVDHCVDYDDAQVVEHDLVNETTNENKGWVDVGQSSKMNRSKMNLLTAKKNRPDPIFTNGNAEGDAIVNTDDNSFDNTSVDSIDDSFDSIDSS